MKYHILVGGIDYLYCRKDGYRGLQSIQDHKISGLKTFNLQMARYLLVLDRDEYPDQFDYKIVAAC